MPFAKTQPMSGRRTLLLGLGSAVVLPGIGRAQMLFSDPPFQLGVASGDPAPDGFVIWTRLAPRPLEPHGGMPMAPVPVTYEVASDSAFRTLVTRGEAIARPELAHSVHVELTGLEPDRPYWYRFVLGRERSMAGRGRTLPAAGAAMQRLRFAAAGCQHFEQGLFTAHRQIANEELDFVWCYGDYIYEYRWIHSRMDSGHLIPTVRQHVGDEMYSLDDYRRRHAQYKSDVDLQAAHAAHSWWVTWDDHETENNWTADIDENGTPPEVFNLRRQAAAQAYYEHMPLRRSSLPRGPAIQLYRRAQYGDLLTASFLDTRQYRSDQPCGDGFKPMCDEASAPGRTILGDAQEKWLFEGLARNPARWNLIAQQIMVMPLDRRLTIEGAPTANMDTWSAYPDARRRLLTHLADRRLTNVVVTTGDEHQNYAGDLSLNPDGRALAVEIVTTSVSSGGDGSVAGSGGATVLANNPHLKVYNNQRGYTLHTVERDLWTTDFKVLDTVRSPGGRLSTLARLVNERGAPGLRPG
jgi:alkaline phosphatase D